MPQHSHAPNAVWTEDAVAGFLLEGRRIGCLLVHGLTSTPQSMAPLGRLLAEQGIGVEALLLPGHGTTPEDLDRRTWTDWYDALRKHLAQMRSRYDRVFVCGQSMGGALALHAAAHEPMAGVISLAGLVYLRDWRLALLPVLKRVMRWKRCIGNDIADPEARDEMCYERMSIRTVEQIVLLGRTVKQDLPRIHVPSLIVQSRVDHVVPPGNADYIYDHIGSIDKEMMRLEHSYHVVSMDYDHTRVAERCVQFMRRIGYQEHKHTA